MDPLSITVSTIALLATVRKAIQCSKILLQAPEHLDSLLNDLTDVKLLIKNVELSLQDSKYTGRHLPERLRQQVSTGLEDAQHQLQALLKLVKKLSPEENKSLNAKHAAHWILAKGRVERFRGKLEKICENLRQSLGEFKTGVIELELQSVSVSLSEASSQRSSLSETVENVAREQREGLAESKNNQNLILERLTNLEKYMYTDNLPAPASDSSSRLDPSVYADRYERVAVRATQRKAVCDIDTCTCECHRLQGAPTQRTLRALLGNIFVGYTGQPCGLRPCTNRFCQRQEMPTSSVTYYFPRWWFAQRMLGLIANLTLIRSNESLPTPPRIVPAPARIFRHALQGDIDTLRAMFAAGLGAPSDTDIETGKTPLHYACSHAQEHTIKYLLNRGADRKQKNFEGLSAIEVAWTRLLTGCVSTENRPILEGVCDEEDLDGFEFTDLHRSVVKLSRSSVVYEIKRLVRRADATIDDLDAHGRSAVSWAAERGDFDALHTLLEYGADPESAKGTKTPLQYAAGTSKSPACISILLQHHADPHARDIAGLNALMWACVNRQRHFANVVPLIGVTDLERTDINDRTALFHAASTDLSPTEAIIRAGANLDHADKDGFTALHMAISYNKPEIVIALVRAKADYLATALNGQNILHHAALYAKTETLNAMVFCQLRLLNVDALDSEGCSPRDRLALRIPPPTGELQSAFDRLLLQINSLKAVRPLLSADASPKTMSPSSSAWQTASEGDISEAVSALGSVPGSPTADYELAFDASSDSEEDEERRSQQARIPHTVSLIELKFESDKLDPANAEQPAASRAVDARDFA